MEKANESMAFVVGDYIEFDYWNGFQWVLESGKIETVGKHGYWVKSDPVCYGTGSIRCPFDQARHLHKEA
jgi:hypothetical protein